ncbi:hypothetical protein WDU94_007310 [Cyamophila willieti]
MFLAIIGSVLESIIPISKSELDIRRNVYRTKHPEHRLPYNLRIPFIDETESWAYEIVYVYQLYIIIYFTEVISPFMFALVISNIEYIVLCLYQMVASSDNISLLRYLKFVGVFFVVLLEFFLICCNSSEVADDCNEMMVNAIKQCRWEMCSDQTRRELCMILRRVQRPNHLKFNEGMIILSRFLFLKVVKLAYSFVNFMRFKTVAV